MKQFHCPGLRDSAYSWAEVKDRFPQSVEVLNDLSVGGMAYDVNGDVWMRLPDRGEAPIVVTDQTARDERLERIATATLQGLITGVVSVPQLAAAHAAGAKEKGFTFEQYLARDAVVMAKALIAELDKQA